MPVALGVNGGVLGSNNLPSSGSAKGIWTTNEIARAVALGFWPVNYARSITETATGADVISTGANADPYFNYTTLLLSTTATNGQQNNTFQDSSTNNFTITRNPATGPNAPTQGTFSPFSQTGWGNYFDGSGDYLTASSTIIPTTGDVTIETWLYPTVAQLSTVVYMAGAGASSDFIFYYNSSGAIGVETGNAFRETATGLILLNTWQHLALTKSGSTYKIFLNGSEVTFTGGALAGTLTQSTLNIGGLGTTNSFAGYLSNLRITQSIVYTVNFTVPTAPLTAISGTSLLTCQSNRFIDNSTNNFTITRNGDTRVVPFSPFNPTSAWSASTVGGSGYFDGTGDYLSNTSNSIVPTTGDFTIEGWFYPSQVSTIQYIFATGGSPRLDVYINSSAYVGIQTGGSYRDSSTTKIIANAWNYIAITRTGSTYAIFVNGVSQTIAGTGTMASTIGNTPTYIGTYSSTTTNFTGYVCGLRVSTSVRTGLTTLPTSPYTSDANTSLLLNFTNAGIYDATAKNVLETVGDAQVSNAVTPKWGSTSIKFDGTGDYLQSPDSELVEFGSGDFTIETWVRFAALPSSGAYYTLVSKWDNSTQKSYLWYVYNASGTYQLYFTYTTNGSTNINPVATITPSINTWYHYAVSRSGANLRLFIDGTQVGSTYNIATDTIFGGTYPLQVGAATGANTLNGYMQDVRITKGYARYTANFTPPTAAFPVQ